MPGGSTSRSRFASWFTLHTSSKVTKTALDTPTYASVFPNISGEPKCPTNIYEKILSYGTLELSVLFSEDHIRLHLFLETPQVSKPKYIQILSYETLELSVLSSVHHLRLHLSDFARVHSCIPPTRIIARQCKILSRDSSAQIDTSKYMFMVLLVGLGFSWVRVVLIIYIHTNVRHQLVFTFEIRALS